MKKTIFAMSFYLLIFGFSGCSSKGMMTAGHNGKMYWNPGDCSQYRYYQNDPDSLKCLQDGVETGLIIKPIDQQQADNYFRQQEMDQRSSDRLRQSLRDATNDTNQQTRDMMNYLKYK